MAPKKSARIMQAKIKMQKWMHGLELPQPKTIAIVAMGSSNVMYNMDFEAGNKKPADEVWAVNSAAVWFRNIDFAIAMDDLRRDKHTHARYVDALTKLPIPLFTTDAYPEYPNTVAYPLKEVVASVFKGSKWLAQKNLQNTVNYAIAIAIHRQATAINLYGCDFTRPDDPRLLRAAFPDRRHLGDPEWFMYHDKQVVRSRAAGEPGESASNFLLGLAFQRGIDIYICNYSTLMDNDRMDHFYGYQEQPQL